MGLWRGHLGGYERRMPAPSTPGPHQEVQGVSHPCFIERASLETERREKDVLQKQDEKQTVINHMDAKDGRDTWLPRDAGACGPDLLS